MKKHSIKIIVMCTLAGAGLLYLRPIFSDHFANKLNVVAGNHRSSTAGLFPEIALKYLQESLQSYGTQVSATIEKQSAAGKEERQADLNYQGTVDAADGAAIVDEKFGSSESINGMCAVAEDQSSAVNAKISSDLWAKAIVKTNLDNRLSAPSAGAVVERELDEHYKEYCSDQDSLRGRCVPSGNGLQNADIDIGTMLQPNYASTLSQEEYAASLAAAKKIVGPVSPPNMLPALERGAGGQNYLLEKRIGDARMSLADNTFAKIIARRRSREDEN